MKSYIKYYRSFIIGIQNAMEYRINFLISLIGVAIPVVIQLFLWTAVYNNSQNSKVYGYTFVEMIVYVVLAGLLSKFVATGFEENMASEIKSGGIGKFLIKPIGHFLYTICCFIGEKAVHMVIMSIIMTICIIGLYIQFGFIITIQSVVFFIISIILAISINFLLFYMLGLIAFYLSEVWGILYGANLAVTIVSGGVLPLETFGPTLLRIFEFLPFKYIIYFPIKIISGKLDNSDIYLGFLNQIFWIIILTFIARLIWKNGLKKFIAAGG